LFSAPDAGSVCPYCGDTLPNPKPRRLAKALEKIILAEERLRRKKQNERSQKAAAAKVDPNPQDSAPRPPRPRPLKRKAVVAQEPQTPVPRVDAAVWADDTDSEPEAGKISLVDQFEFCRIHVAETTIVPDGLRKNYPVIINFDELGARVDRMKEKLLDVIKGTVESKYLERAKETYKSLGTMGARQPAVMLATVQDTQVTISCIQRHYVNELLDSKTNLNSHVYTLLSLATMAPKARKGCSRS